ncbi:hypothetical protein [Streptomyces sp. NPDC050388]|uniref:hypothetical protein n=1 Tax=Streptomyces sp. NPDC050388 TaxID=3155781 RepID=UPI0034340740
MYNRPVRLRLHAALIRRAESRALFTSSKESAKSVESMESEELESRFEESHHAETGGGVKTDAAAVGAETTGAQNGAGRDAGKAPTVTLVLGERGGRAACTLAIHSGRVQRSTAVGEFGRATGVGEPPANDN